MKLSQDVISILDVATIEDHTVRLTCGQLERRLYLSVNEALEAMGGKWNRKVQGHVFTDDPRVKIESAILTGETIAPKEFGYFYTPSAVVDRLMIMADIQPGMTVLEPSAGRGHIAERLRKTDCDLSVIELLEDHRKVLADNEFNVIGTDFLEHTGTYDRIVMNPPFGNKQDIDHVLHAYDCLNNGGRAVAVMSAGVLWRNDRKTVEFRVLLEEQGTWEELPEDSFKESGTGVRAIIVAMEK